ncbi:MAG: prolyl oligopeptidase family serine peptidase [Rhodobacteraceae bacterium]|nr:prolyl oligopeptidase family serine peptidase [Paracoccaceae bacterium]
MIRKLLLTLSILQPGTAAQAGCAADPAACKMDNGEYHIVLPDSKYPQPSIVVFLHGAGGTGGAVLKNKNLVNSFLDRGYAFLAPTGSAKFGKGKGTVWRFYPEWNGRDETEFLKNMVVNAGQRFDLDTDSVLLSGFSAGGFMVYYLACDAPETFAAYASVSGGFWDPLPTSCKAPVKLLHTHGWKDKTVPLEGRALRDGTYQQGDIFAGLNIWHATNQCAQENPDVMLETDQFWRRKWSRNCADGSALELALFPGGHRVPSGWSTMVMDWFEEVTSK